MFICLFSSLFFSFISFESVVSSDIKVDLWWIFSSMFEDFLCCAHKRKGSTSTTNQNEYLHTAWDSKYLAPYYVSSSMDTELRYVLFNHYTFRTISSTNSLAVLYECLTWSLIQGSNNNRNRTSRNISWEKSGPQIVEIRCTGSYV